MIPAINDLVSIVLNRPIVFSGTNLPIKRPYAQVVMVANHVTGKRPLRSRMNSIVFSGTNLPIKRSYAEVVIVDNHVTGNRPLRSLMSILRPGIGREKGRGRPVVRAFHSSSLLVWWRLLLPVFRKRCGLARWSC